MAEKIKYNGKNLELLNGDAKFRFTCDKCGRCCSNFNIMLNPYDIIRICTNKKITTTEFIKQYCEYYIGNDSKLPILVLKTNSKCQFNDKGLCLIYEDRPLRCRTYPIGRLTKLDINQKNTEEKFFVENNCSRIPFRLQNLNMISEWLENQKSQEYLDKSKEWNDLAIKWVKIKAEKTAEMQNLLFVLAYDFDKNERIKQINSIDEKYGAVIDGLKIFLNACQEYLIKSQSR